VPTPLYDPTRERDACGIGLVADARGRASRELLDRALAGLAAVMVTAAVVVRCTRRLGGITGDVLGACVELSFTAALLVLAAS